MAIFKLPEDSLNLTQIDTDTLSEGSNLFFTNARSISAFTAGDSISIDSNGLVSAAVSSSAIVDAISAGENINIDANGLITATDTNLSNAQIAAGINSHSATGANIIISGSGALAIGYSDAGSYKLAVNGTGLFNQTIYCQDDIVAYFSSDKNLKENIHHIDSPLYKVMQLNGVYFDWKDEVLEKRGGEDNYFNRKRDTGIIAQDVEKVLPEVVATRDDGTKAVKYEKIIGLLVEAIKSLKKEVDTLKNGSTS